MPPTKLWIEIAPELFEQMKGEWSKPVRLYFDPIVSEDGEVSMLVKSIEAIELSMN